MVLMIVNVFKVLIFELIEFVWVCLFNIEVYMIMRIGGVSLGEFVGLNVGSYVGDDLFLVKVNRCFLFYSDKIIWLE